MLSSEVLQNLVSMGFENTFGQDSSNYPNYSSYISRNYGVLSLELVFTVSAGELRLGSRRPHGGGHVGIESTTTVLR